MGIYSLDWECGFGGLGLPHTPRLTIRCEYPGWCSPPDEVSFRISPHYGISSARQAHEWFLDMMRAHDEFEVMTDKPGKWPVPFSSATVRRVVVE